MQATDLNDYWNKLNALPQDLKEIMLTFWDETGRPQVMYPKNDAIMALLNKTAKNHEDGKSFLTNMQLIFPEMKSEEAAIYYNAFMTGANCVANQMIENHKKGNSV